MASELLDKTLVTKAPNRCMTAPSDREGTLTVLIGADVGATHSVTTTVVLGRGPEAQISLDDDGISRRHCRLLRVPGGYELEDLASTNGVYVDYERVTARMPLKDGARIQVGNTVLRFALLDKLEQETSKRMYEMAVRDGLTSTYNRRYFDERMESEFAFAARHGTALCVLLVDLDHFKRINDTFGHQAGDLVLRRVSSLLRSGVRAEDVVARYGGEEFAVIARGIDVAGAKLFAERVRSMVERAHIDFEGATIAVTASIGLAHNHSGGACASPDKLVLAADNALYAAKRSGRNRVELATSPGRYSSTTGRLAGGKQRGWEQATSPSSDEGTQRRSARAASRHAAPTEPLNPGGKVRR